MATEGFVFSSEARRAYTPGTHRFDHRTTDDIDGIALANARAKMLEGMGATLPSVAPRVGSQGSGHFVVDATWQRNEASLAKLHAALSATRAEHAKERSATWLQSLTRRIRTRRGG